MSRLRFLVTLLAAITLGASGASAQQKDRDLSGKWAFAVTTENGTGYPTVILKQEGDKVTGTYESQRMGLRALAGTIQGDTLHLTMKSGSEGMPDFTFVGILLDKDNVKGNLEMGGMGSASFTGKRGSPTPP
ncbi:MAG: hypothetical protein ABI877_08595 [Gemmatimonadaceae bacterium]